jgi:hypothetical protein
MSTEKLTNISVAAYRLFLTRVGCARVRISGGHEIWTKHGLLRPITFQTHIDPVPEFIIKNGLRTLGMTKSELFKVLTNRN